MNKSTLDRMEEPLELTEYEQGFVDMALFRMGVVDRQPTLEEFVKAVGELDAFVKYYRAVLDYGGDTDGASTSNERMAH
jgi:hypothetical protein